MAETSNSKINDETELTMCDVLEEEQELEEDANAVLGGSDDTNCSYDKGYVPRQALYACVTCSTEDPSGVCLACSYKCHDGHEIVELYTKRNFRCDCGNSKFAGKTCFLKPDKESLNNLNKYNQNFKGLYCSCSRPYPDLEDNTPDEMIQCVMCEDWYHGRHIGGVVPDDYFEMICSKCMESHKFLYVYLNKFSYVNVTDKTVLEKKGECNGISKVTSCSEDEKSPQVEANKNVTDKTVLEKEGECNGVSKVTACSEDEKSPHVEVTENKKHIKTEEITKKVTDSGIEKIEKCTEDNSHTNEAEIKSETEKTVKNENLDCFLNKFCMKSDGITHGPAFWPQNWRKELCQCTSCMDMYQKYQCGFLLNIEDTILAYEEQGKSTNESQYDKGLNALSKLDRVKQMEAVRAYTSMKGQLKEYLKDFADNKRTVCESDIKEFFERISKRQKLSNGVPHFCR